MHNESAQAQDCAARAGLNAGVACAKEEWIVRQMNDPGADRPNEKKLQLAPFAIHATRGLLRDRQMRRRTMLVLTIAALLLLFCGATFLTSTLDPQTRPGWFIVYWLVCAWITFAVVLLAIFDLLLVRAEERRERRRLAEKLAETAPNDHA